MSKTSTNTSTALSNTNAIDGCLSSYQWTRAQTLTYSCPQAASNYIASGGYGAGTETDTFQACNTTQIAVVDYWISQLALITTLGFTKITESDILHADIRVALSNLPGTSWAYLPTGAVIEGDVWIGLHFNNNNWPRGTYSHCTVGHELGHTVGMKHPHQNGANSFPTMSAGINAQFNTIMSYSSYIGAGDPGWSNGGDDYMQTYGYLDQQALNYCYP